MTDTMRPPNPKLTTALMIAAYVALLTILAITLFGCTHPPSSVPAAFSRVETRPEMLRRVAASTVFVLARAENAEEVHDASGSGTVVWTEPNGGKLALILTCRHVVYDEGFDRFVEKIRVKSYSGTWSNAFVLDEKVTYDLALLLAVESLGAPALSIAPREPDLYEKVRLIASPGAKFGTVAEGILSSKAYAREGILLWQVTSFVFPGSSGGTAIDDVGDLVAVPESVFVGAPFGVPEIVPQIGYCVPLPSIRAFLRPYGVL